MVLPQIAIVGRPNVGKSSLLNRLARKRISIVAAEPGVTRDRVSAIIEVDSPQDRPRETPARLVEVVDTGGFGAYTALGKRFDDVGADLATLSPDIEAQIAIAAEQADLILLVVDVQEGLSSLDTSIATLLRHNGLAGKVLLVANKTDSAEWLAEGAAAAVLGFGEPTGVSATSGFGVAGLLAAIWHRLPPPEAARERTDDEIKIAIVAKRNAGKSSLINALAGEPRVIVSEIAGTTRDSIDVRFEMAGRRMLAIDTAGVRKRKSFAHDIELYAYHRMLASIRRADVVVLMIDATVEVSQVDKKLTLELQALHKPTVIAVNKWDLVEDRVKTGDYLEYLTEQLRGLSYAPIVFLSATAGKGLRDLVAMVFNLYQQAGHFETTGRLNQVIESILRRRGPSPRLGRQAKVYYVSQIDAHPPTIALVVNDPLLFEGPYERYLLNRLREELPYSEVPIRLLFRARKRMTLSELKSGGSKARRHEGTKGRRDKGTKGCAQGSSR